MTNTRIKTENIEEAKQVFEVPQEVKKWQDSQENFIIVERGKLASLLTQLEEAKKERAVLYNCAFSIMDLFGFIDKTTGKMKPEIASGEESFIPGMLKSLTDVTASLLKAKSGFTKKMREEAEQDLAKKFEFIKELLPIILKYGQNGK